MENYEERLMPMGFVDERNEFTAVLALVDGEGEGPITKSTLAKLVSMMDDSFHYIPIGISGDGELAMTAIGFIRMFDQDVETPVQTFERVKAVIQPVLERWSPINSSDIYTSGTGKTVVYLYSEYQPEILSMPLLGDE